VWRKASVGRWKQFNPNPAGRSNVGDCSVRAIAAALDVDWETAFALIAKNAYQMGNVISANEVWGSVLRQNGFKRYAIENTCPDCYSMDDFAIDHPNGTYVVGTGNHVATIKDGRIYDSWDSSNEIPQYYWARG
jgi:hypothetical protein